MTGNKCSKMMAFIEKWINKTDGVTERGQKATALGQKQDIFKS